MTAFGPYKGKETIDFEQLDGANLFVISGNTGAGKTTIFDGICFALYGSASGEDRGTSAMLRSHFADDDDHTSVEFIFALHQRTYRVLRQLSHIKKGNRTATGERYELYEIRTDGEVPVVDRQMVSEINEKIEQMIGLTQQQFKQIVMLPQGEFRKLLTSDTENKERILRKIFKTERYNELNDRMREKRDTIQKTYEQEVHERNHFILQIGSIFPPREGVPLFEYIEAEEKNMYQIEDELTKEIHYYTEKTNNDKKAYEEAYNKHQKKQTMYIQAQTINALFTEREEKQKRAEILKEQLPFIKEKETNLRNADRASRIVVYEKHANDFLRAEHKQVQQLKDIQTAHDISVNKRDEAEEAFKAEEKRVPEKEQFKKDLDTYEGYLPDVKEMKESEKQLQYLLKQTKQAKLLLETSTTDVEKNQKVMEELRNEIATLDEQTSPLIDKIELRNAMREQVTPIKQYLQSEQEFNKLNKQITEEETAYNIAQNKYEQLEDQWLHSQASILATHLHDGEACPVCGSTDHPNKGFGSKENISRKQLSIVKKEVDEKNAIYRTSIGTRQEINKRLAENWEEIYAQFSIERHEASEQYSKLVEKGKRLTKEVDDLTKKKEQLDAKKKQLETLIQTDRTIVEKRDKTKNEYDEKLAAYNKVYTIYERQQQHIPKEIQSLEVLEKSIQETTMKMKELERSWDKAQTALQQIKDRQTQVTAQKESAERELTEAKERTKQATNEFQEALKKGEFSSKEAYEQALLDENMQTTLKTEIDEFHQERVILSERLTQLEKELVHKEFVPLDALKIELDTLQKTYEEAWEVMHTSKQYVERGKTIKEQMLTAHKQVKVLEGKRTIVADVYDVIRGQNGPKISFERYIQMDYLEQIIEAANERFRILSNGQYTLLRSDRQETHGRQSGLALDVHDAYTGQKRDVKSLSGGEKFNASLSLALGMSDVVQSFQGNVSVETMFIDEGFGTLDEESLQNAIDTLIDLQRSGRMIGVISHVDQLKELFPAVLEVTKTKEGFSETKFVVK